MARKLNIPKDKQIKGLRKAIANRRTPRQFFPSLKKRLAKLTGSALVLFALVGCVARPMIAQTPVTIQPLQQTLAPAGTACSSSAQTYTVNNRNQTQHNVYIATTSSLAALTVQVVGVDAAGNPFLISDTATTGFFPGGLSGNARPILTASGYYPTVNVIVNCSPNSATYTLTYSGTSGAGGANIVAGGAQLTQENKVVSAAISATSTTTLNFQTPWDDSFGAMVINFGGSPPTGPSVTLTCVTAANAGPTVFTFNPGAGLTTFTVPSQVCPIANVVYNGAGTGGSGTVSVEYIFYPPGSTGSNFSFYFTGSTTAQEVKNGSGKLHVVTVNTPAAGTISLFNLPASLCTGTPSTNVIGIITATASAPIGSLFYDTLFTNGLCVKASSASIDFTVSYQ